MKLSHLSMRVTAYVFLAAALFACGGPPRQTYAAVFTDRSIRIASYTKAFRSAEPMLVRGLEHDSRLLARMIPKPTSAQLASDAQLAFGGGEWLNHEYSDPFMFSDREAALARVRSELERVAMPNDIALEAEMYDPLAKITEDPDLRQIRLEQAAFRRTLDAEDARLERERTLPKGAADLVRAMAVAWPIAPTPGQMHDLESMIVFRLENLEQSLAPNSLSEAEREDLRDELGAFAPRLARMPKALAQMAKLRKVLESMWITPYAVEDEATIDKELAMYVGSPLSFDALDGAFESAARSFGGQIDAGLSVLDAETAARVRARAKQILFDAPACMPRVPVRGPLDMAPPEERAWACSLLHALDDAKTDLDELSADLAFHDAVVVARWAVSTHGPVRAPDAALRLAHPRLDLTPTEQSRLLRLARARPYRAIAAGVAASILVRDGAAHARPRAHHWRGIGDAPMDVVDEILAPPKK